MVIQSPYGPVKRSRVQVSSKLVNYRPFRNIIPVRKQQGRCREQVSVNCSEHLVLELTVFQFSCLYFFTGCFFVKLFIIAQSTLLHQRRYRQWKIKYMKTLRKDWLYWSCLFSTWCSTESSNTNQFTFDLLCDWSHFNFHLCYYSRVIWTWKQPIWY